MADMSCCCSSRRSFLNGFEQKWLFAWIYAVLASPESTPVHASQALSSPPLGTFDGAACVERESMRTNREQCTALRLVSCPLALPSQAVIGKWLRRISEKMRIPLVMRRGRPPACHRSPHLDDTSEGGAVCECPLQSYTTSYKVIQ